jgi:hypothetical protein
MSLMERATAKAVPALLAISAAYSVVAALAYLLHFSAHPLPLWPYAAEASAAVLVPYALLLIAIRIAHDEISRWTTASITVTCALAAAEIYADSFNRREVADMYALTFFALPAVQSMGAVLALAVSAFRRRAKTRGVQT